MATVILVKNNEGDSAELRSHSWTGTGNTIAGGGWWLLEADDEIATLAIEDVADLSLFAVESQAGFTGITLKNMNASPLDADVHIELVDELEPDRIIETWTLKPGESLKETIGGSVGIRLREVPKKA